LFRLATGGWGRWRGGGGEEEGRQRGGRGAVVEVISMLSMGVLELYSFGRSRRVERERG